MDGRDISITITSICEKYGINYHSVNKATAQLIQDAKRLAEIKMELKRAEGDLQEISERHNLNGMGTLLRDDIITLERIDHDLTRIAQKLSDERKKEDMNED